MSPFSYMLANPAVPTRYVCGDCGATGCKLWRESATFHLQLVCGACLIGGRADVRERVPINADGTHDSYWLKGFQDRRSVQYMGWVPAVPDEGGEGYYWVTCIPQDGFAWWQALPSMPTESNAGA